MKPGPKLCLTKKDLEESIELGLITYQIAIKFNCSKSSVLYAASKYSLNVSGRKTPCSIKYDKEILEDQYLIQNIKVSELAKIYNCLESHIYAVLKKHKISKKPFSFTREGLSEYVRQNLNVYEIAEIFNCNKATVWYNLVKFNLTLNGKHKSRKWDDSRYKIWHNYRASANTRKLSFTFTQEQFFKLIIQPCTYCGRVNTSNTNTVALKHHLAANQGIFRYTGIDRVDSSKNYDLDNCVACCKTCNYAKRDMKIEEFKEWIQSIVKFNK